MITLSYSSLQTYSTCPKMYYFRYVEKLPSRMNGAMSFGTSIHNTLYRFFELLLPDEHNQSSIFHEPKPEPTQDDLLTLLDRSWIETGYTDKKTMYARKVEALSLLTKWYEKYAPNFGSPILLESKFSLKEKNALLTGRFDRIDQLPDGSLEVIDYKTGRLRDQEAVDGDKQLTMYALAVEKFLKRPVGKLSLYFFEHDVTISTKRTEEQLNEFTGELEAIASGISSQHFSPTPSQKICTQCDFSSLCSDSLY